MIRIEKIDVYGWEAAIRGMRNPMNSWDKSDSGKAVDCGKCGKIEREGICNGENRDCTGFEIYHIGENDMDLMQRLFKAGSEHRKYLRFVTVTMDITAPFYWWKEFKTYRKGRQFLDDGDEILDPEEMEMFVETNSCSTMHKIYAKEFTVDDFSFEKCVDDVLALNHINDVLWILNRCREQYLETKEKKLWYMMVQLLPSSYNQKRTVQINYEVAVRMIQQRKNHKLDEWREFVGVLLELPHMKEIMRVQGEWYGEIDKME